jgi:hypothetical protein
VPEAQVETFLADLEGEPRNLALMSVSKILMIEGLDFIGSEVASRLTQNEADQPENQDVDQAVKNILKADQHLQAQFKEVLARAVTNAEVVAREELKKLGMI